MKCFWAVGLMVGLLMVLPAAAQIAEVGAAELNNASIEISLSKAPSAAWMQPVLPVVASAAKVQTVPEAHQVFLDRPAGIRFSVLAGLIAADGITTQRVLSMAGTRELNPLARPFVTHGAAGQLAASSLGYAFGIGTSYFFHRTGHHKMERIFENVAIGVESACVTNNLIQGARLR
ncbi:MAG: hypothetical protein DMG70_27125 [Acidobacteria bacterium]|nr:MAG: hypothetical protein DMG70_27125 [Acidobacteriota bacterium]PYY08461.1 MAG: hypothetical protein DMG69_14600 [Acidobacteriota bacterium]